MSKVDAIRNAIETAEKHGFTPPPALKREVAELENPQYRIAVVGKFQVGKSTLINKVFLQDNPILWEGDGLCTTSVTTEVQYGQTPRMEVYRWKDASKTEEVLDKSMDNPTAENLKSVTVGSDRVALADTVSRVKLFTPNESLKGYTILDTPGLDDPNPEILMNTTYRVIPGCDLAIIVADAKMLDQIELDLIRNKLISEGISKFMVLLSYRPKSDTDETMRQNIQREVESTLRNIGKEDVPVAMYCFDESVDDILCTSTAIFLKIRNFLRDNALAGRQARVAHNLKRFLGNCQLELAAKIKAAGQSDEENKQLAEATRKKLAEVEKNNEQLIRDIKSIFDRNKTTESKIRGKISPVFSKFVDELEHCDLSAVKNKLERSDDLRVKLANALADYTNEISDNIRRQIEDRTCDFGNLNKEWYSFLEERFSVSGGKLVGILRKTPNIVIEIINLFGLDIFLPGGIIIAAIARGLQGLLPVLKDLTLGKLVKSFIVNRAKSALADSENQIAPDAVRQINDALDKVCENIGGRLNAQYREQARIITDNLAADTAKADGAACESAQAEIGETVGRAPIKTAV